MLSDNARTFDAFCEPAEKLFEAFRLAELNTHALTTTYLYHSSRHPLLSGDDDKSHTPKTGDHAATRSSIRYARDRRPFKPGSCLVAPVSLRVCHRIERISRGRRSRSFRRRRFSKTTTFGPSDTDSARAGRS